MWRHGDVLVAAVPMIPAKAQRRPSNILVRGEATGHSHRILEADSAETWESRGELYLKIYAASATLVHEEHKPITLSKGYYRVWVQREYSPRAIRRVID